MQVWGITDRGSVRKENQDAYGVTELNDTTLLALVCDGMGGARAGNVASLLALNAFTEAVREDFGREDDPSLAPLLIRGADKANLAVFHHAMEHEDCQGMGTTLVAAAVTEKSVFVVNVGDSRCYLVTEASITQVTRDHSLVEDLVARGDITPEEARNHPQKNLITRALGVDKTVQPDIFQLERQADGFLLLCSDGLSNQVTDPELLNEIIHGGEPSTCCQRLLDIALSRGAPDNVTAVLMQL